MWSSRQVPPGIEQFRKDLEKLAREGMNGLWFHTIATSNAKTLTRLVATIGAAMELVNVYTSVAIHTITFAICVLDKRLLLSSTVTLGAGLDSQIQALSDPGSPVWERWGNGVDDAKLKGTSVRPAVLQATQQSKLLVYCPSITPDTLLHFSRKGDSYRLRAFSGSLAGRAPWIEPEAPTASAFLELYAPELSIDVSKVVLPLTEFKLWERKVLQYNLESGIPLA
jgi:hypothetical protein